MAAWIGEALEAAASGQCRRCIFRFTGKAVCVAFPRGIPADIWEGRFDHTKPYPGDGGIRFAPAKREKDDRHNGRSCGCG